MPEPTDQPSPRHHGTLTAGDEPARAVRLAGALAELAVTTLTLHRPDAPPLELSARATDLPRELMRALERRTFEPIVLLAPQRELEVRLDEAAWLWATNDEEAAEAMRRIET
ncbi:MAG: hypothetical protein EA378_02570 [Phycisphaerales bacterium]|nr:MAG: hypothetical protein EA378_02570 [Phycisphaerales bacterium]